MRDERTLPAGWSVLRLAAMVSFPQGQLDPKRAAYSEWPLIAPDHIEQRTGTLLSVQTAREQNAISGKYPFMPGDVLYSKIRPYLRKAVLADCEGLCSADMYPLRAKQGLIPRFLLALVLGEDFSHFAEIVSVRSGFPKINRTEFGEYFAHVPPVEEQRQIAVILDTLDDAIRRTEQVIAKLQQMKQGLLHDLLTRGVDEHGDLRPLPEESPHLYKDSPLWQIPRAWTVPVIDELAVHVGSGVTPRGGSETYLSSGVPLIRSQNVHFDGLRLDDVAFISQTTHRSMARSEVFQNDVLLNITGASIGRCCPVPGGLGMANVNQHVCAIRLAESTSADAQYLSAFLGSPFGQHQVDVLNAGSNRQGLNYQQVRAFRVLWPARGERERAVAVIATHDDSDVQERRSLGTLRAIKCGLVYDLLAGRVRVSTAEAVAS